MNRFIIFTVVCAIPFIGCSGNSSNLFPEDDTYEDKIFEACSILTSSVNDSCNSNVVSIAKCLPVLRDETALCPVCSEVLLESVTCISEKLGAACTNFPVVCTEIMDKCIVDNKCPLRPVFYFTD